MLRTTLTATAPVRPLAHSAAAKISVVLAGSILMALSAHASVPLWFTPVPLTLQTLALIVLGLTFGRAAAFATMVLYLLEGASGLPVFSPAGPSGIAHLLGPTAGFLFSYPVAAPVAGAVTAFFQTKIGSFSAAILGGIAATIIFLFSGAFWLANVLHLTVGAAFHVAATPFLPGEGLKIVLAALLFQAIRRRERDTI